MKTFVLFLSVVFSLNLFSKDFNRGNYLIYIDPGHQKTRNKALEERAPNSKIKKTKVSSGTQGIKTKKYEYQLTLEIGLKLKEALRKKGYKVKMTRETNDVNISNKERAILVNESKASLYIRLHSDGDINKSVNGASVLIASKKNKHYTSNLQKQSENFAKILINEYSKATNFKNRGISYRDDLTGTNWSKVPNILLEMGFMSNEAEDMKMSDEKYQEKMVQGIINGIEYYLKKYDYRVD
ncbi:MAG: N-acetylmuramoyl-L-alanine amidase [Fusobacterium sp.]|nr:N-acetylmuramoyl-L-alanine amidase [Fusobacterium sp.]